MPRGRGRGRGRPSNVSSLSSRSNFLKKPKAYQQQASDSDSRCSTPSGIARSRSTRNTAKQALVKTRTYVSQLLDNGEDSEFDSDDDIGPPVKNIEDDEMSYDSSVGLSEDDVASVWSEASISTVSDTPSKRKLFPRRPKSPEFVDPAEIPPLDLPPSSDDVFIPSEHILATFSIYEVLRHFKIILRLSPFRFEDFCAALVSEEKSTLLAEVHITLLKALLRAEDGNNTTFGPSDMKDSINVTMFFLDSMTWYEVARAYLESDRATEFKAALPAFSKADYCSATLSDRIQILQTLTDLFLTTNMVREEIMNEGNIKYDDHCRNCHRSTYVGLFCIPPWVARLGDLLCCETCSAVYHLTCVDPPMEEVPDDDWICSVCKAHKVPGVYDCISDAEKNGILCRQEPLGYDRFRRKYYFICRRIVVEGENDVRYYSTKPQIDELLDCLDGRKWEIDLIRTIKDLMEEIDRQLRITEDLTKEHKGNKKSALELEIANIQKLREEREENRKREEEERKQRALEERQKLEEEELRRQEEEEKEEEEERMREEQEQRDAEERIREQIMEVDREKSGENSRDPNDLEMEEISTEDVTTSTETVTSTAVSEGLLTQTEQVIETTVTTTTKTVTMCSEAGKATSRPEQGSGDAPALANDVDAEEVVTTDSVADESEELKPKDSIQSVLPTTQLRSADGKIVTPGRQLIVQAGNQTLMVVTKDGKKTLMRVIRPPASDGATLVTSSVSSSTESSTLENRRVLTRSATGSLTPKLFSDSITSSASIIKSTASKSSEEELMYNINKEGQITRVTRSKMESSKTGLSIIQHLSHFRLGMEGNYKTYVNQYSTNTLALNKHQHNEERDKRRHLSHKFSLTQASEFKWNGSTHGTRSLILSTLRQSIAHLETNVPTPFLHPNWPIHRQNWIKAVHMCHKPEDFALALTILEASLKPVVMNPVWHEALGHTRLMRLTALDREELKKREKYRKDDEDFSRLTWAKFTLGLKHQVWKQKGEEFRLAGNGGWLWVRSSRVARHVPQDTVGLRLVAAKLKAKRLKEMEAEKNLDTNDASVKEEDKENDKVNKDIKDKTEQMCVEESVESERKLAGSEKDVLQNALSDKENDVKTEDEMLNNAEVKMEDDDDDEDFKKPVEDVIDVTKALINRTRYVKTTKPYSRLDTLLEKRMRQYEAEEKQKMLFKQIIARYRQQEVKKHETKVEEKSTPANPESFMVVDFKDETAKSRTKSPYQCYSATCPCRKRENDVKKERLCCYSVTCSAFDDVEEDDSDDESVAVDLDKDKVDPVKITKDDEDEEMDVDVVGDKKDEINSPLKPKPAPKPEPPSSGSSASLLTQSTSGVISLQSLAKGGKIQLTGQLVKEIELRLQVVGSTKNPVKLFKNARNRIKTKAGARKGNLPPGHKFITRSKKRNLFILENHEAATMARKGGHWESKCFNYNCKMNNVNWLYPCPRPLFKTTWRYRTQCISNLSAASVQLRVLWATIRWDDLGVKPPATHNTTTTETEITTTELLKRRDVGAHGLRSEFLVRKLIVPIGVPSQPREDYTPQRRGLRERKRREEPRNTEPSVTESWVPEEQLEIWEIKMFGDKVEKQRAALQDKLQQQQQAQQKQAGAAKLKAEIEDQLKQQRLAMQQKRLEQQKDGAKPQLSILQKISTPQTASAIRVITTSLPGSTTPSLVRVTPVRPSTVLSKTVVTTPFNKVALQPKTLLTAALGGKISLPATTIQLRPKTILTTAGTQSATATMMTNTPGLKPIAPSTSQAKVGTQLQIKPQISGAATPAAANAAAAAVQNLRIIQGPNGQLQVQGLLPGQQLVKLPDGRLQLITSSAASAALQQKQATSGAPATPTKPQVQIRPQIQAQPPTTESSEVSAEDTSNVTQEQHQTIAQPQVAQIQVAPVSQVSQNPVVPTQIVIQSPSGVVTQQQIAQAQQLVQQKQQQILVQQQLAQAQKILPQTVQIRGGTMQIRPQTSLPQLMSVTGSAILSTSQGNVVVSAPIVSHTMAKSSVVSAVLTSPTQSSIATLVGGQKVILSTAPQASLPTVIPSGVKPVTPVLQQLQQQLQQQKLALGSALSSPQGKVLLTPANKASLSGGHPTIVKLPNGQQFLIRTPITQTAAAAAIASIGKTTGTASTTIPTVVSALPTMTAAVGAAVTSASSATPPASTSLASPTSPGVSESTGKYQVTPQLVQQVVKQAMMQTQDPEIQAKLAAMQRQMAQKDGTSPVVIPAKRKIVHDFDEDDEELEDYEDKLIQKQQALKQAKVKINLAQKDEACREMLKKRSVLEKTLEQEIRADVNDMMRRTKRAIKRKQYKSAWDEEYGKTKKQKVISTNNKRPSVKSNRLYCICKSPFDPSRFYVGCDLCSNWFHGECIGITEQESKFVDSYVCDECKAQQENTSEELYCVCKTPYDESQFYIGCDKCQDWFHGTCVGVSKGEADSMDIYVCPRCKAGAEEASSAQKSLTMQHLTELRVLLKSLQSHKMSWPFREPVDPKEVPDYYTVIKDPMDFSTISKKLDAGEFTKLDDFVKDVMKVFDNCRYYNAPDSPFYQCAEVLEPHFVQLLKPIKEKI